MFQWPAALVPIKSSALSTGATPALGVPILAAIATFTLVAILPRPASAEAPPLGTWLAEDGTKITVRPCTTGYCAAIASGKFSGEWEAQVKGPGPEFNGKVRDPQKNKVYDGGLLTTGKALELRGCLAKVFCKTVQTWRRP